jgi:predicted adenine nucleotide alpha hydrolase (AANH) superfamily ATPase
MDSSKPSKKLLIHVCCAPDATVVIERLSPEYDLTIFFYNPNIHPEKEYHLRSREMENLLHLLHIPFIPAEYDSSTWFELVNGLEHLPEGGERCTRCFKMRLEKTAKIAAESKFDLFTTVLSVSPHKDANLINEIGKEVGQKWGVPFMEANFKKKDGFKRSLELSKHYGLYRQDYCGCIFSQIEREKFRSAR